MILNKAILLLGPTGSGKTPLGNLLEQNGFQGRQCFHFDFGQHLRTITTAAKPDKNFTVEEIAFINQVLTSSALLENKYFYLARKILNRFITEKRIGPDGWIILNGLPRHLGQARELDGLLDIKTVVHLASTPEIILDRIRNNAGGDRLGRTDDDLDSIRNKLFIFNQRTAELMGHYQSKDARIIRIDVTETSTADDVMKALARQF